MAAQECLPNHEVRDAFAAEYSALGKLSEAVSPDLNLPAYEQNYRCPSSQSIGTGLAFGPIDSACQADVSRTRASDTGR